MKRKYSKVIKKIARQEGVCESVVYEEIQKAIEAGYNNPNPEVQTYWRKLAPNGKMPTVDEAIEILVKELR